MALHDFFCPVCGQVLVDIDIPVAVGAAAGAPVHCGRPTAWIAAVGRMDASNGPGFHAFEVRDGQNRLVTIDSLAALRRLERTSEQQARNGDGQPLAFRAWSNDRSNRDVHTLHPTWQGGEAPDPAFVKKHAGAIRRSADVADTAYGPGVSDATPSALDALDRASASGKE